MAPKEIAASTRGVGPATRAKEPRRNGGFGGAATTSRSGSTGRSSQSSPTSPAVSGIDGRGSLPAIQSSGHRARTGPPRPAGDAHRAIYRAQRVAVPSVTASAGPGATTASAIPASMASQRRPWLAALGFLGLRGDQQEGVGRPTSA